MNTVRDRCGWGGSIALHKSNLNHAHPAPCSLKDELLKLLETLALQDQGEKLAANGIKIRCDLAWVDTNDVQYLCGVWKQTLMCLLEYSRRQLRVLAMLHRRHPGHRPHLPRLHTSPKSCQILGTTSSCNFSWIRHR